MRQSIRYLFTLLAVPTPILFSNAPGHAWGDISPDSCGVPIVIQINIGGVINNALAQDCRRYISQGNGNNVDISRGKGSSTVRTGGGSYKVITYRRIIRVMGPIR
jgi:hypothetical protein